MADLSGPDVRRAIQAAQAAFSVFRTTHRERRFLIRRWADRIKANKEDLAAICTMELGKPYTESLVTVQYGIDFLDWFEGAIERTFGETISAAKSSNRIFTLREPQGVVAAITPWNSPIAMVTRKVGAAIAAGNTVVCKPAPETPLCALALAKLFEQAGCPPGVFNVVPCSASNAPIVGDELCKSPVVRHLSFTGSTAVGKYLNTECAKTIKRISLELGGNAPFIVFDDANLDNAVSGLIASKFRSSGQTCVCANRVFIHSSLLLAFADALRRRLDDTFTYGSVWNTSVNFGPLYSSKGRRKVEEHLTDALSHGATLHSGGAEASQGFGPNMFQPTIVIGGDETMKFMNEETFGAIAFLVPFETEDEVIRLANNTVVGLAAYFYTENISRVWRVSEALQVGMVGVRVGLVSAAEQPFGGVLESGLGREGGSGALQESLDVTSISLAACDIDQTFEMYRLATFVYNSGFS